MTQDDTNSIVKAVICGAQKAGTTSLSYYLRQHPELDVPNKELHFFDNETVDWKKPDYRKYENKFLKQNKTRIDHTPIYMFWNPCCERIYKYNPNMKIIAILRNPSERAYSQWAMEKNRGSEKLSFYQALEAEINANKCNPFEQSRVRSYLERGMYCKQIERLWQYFGKSNVCIVKQEDLKSRTEKTVRMICNYLNVNPNYNFDGTKQRVGQYPKTISGESPSCLKELFLEEVNKLEILLDWDCSEWKPS